MKRDVLADAIDVLSNDWIVNKLALLIDLRGEATAQRNFLIERIEVDLTLVDIALADQTRVFIFPKLAFDIRRRCLLDGLLVLRRIFRIFLLIRKQCRRHTDQCRQQQNGDALQQIYFHWKDSYRKELLTTGTGQIPDSQSLTQGLYAKRAAECVCGWLPLAFMINLIAQARIVNGSTHQ